MQTRSGRRLAASGATTSSSPSQTASAAAASAASLSPRSSRGPRTPRFHFALKGTSLERRDQAATLLKDFHRLRGQALPDAAKAIVAHVRAFLMYQDQVRDVKKGKRCNHPEGAYVEQTAQLCGVGVHKVREIWREAHEWRAKKRRRFTQQAVRKPRNFASRVAAEKLDEADVLPVIKAFVAECREKHLYCSCIQITEHLISKCKLRMEAGRDPAAEFTRLHLLVYRFLKRRGWINKLVYTKPITCNAEELRQHVRQFVAFMDANQNPKPAADTPVYREFYVHESFIHESLHDAPESLVDPATHQREGQTTPTGSRWAFIAGVLGPDWTVPELDRTLAQEAQFVSMSLDYVPDDKHSAMPKRHTQDGHAMFTGEFFEAWVEKVATHLQSLGVRAVFIMDNAAHHRRRGALRHVVRRKTAAGEEVQVEKAVLSSRKAEIIATAKRVGAIPQDADPTNLWADDVKRQFRAWAAKQPSTVERILSEHGHIVRTTPPHIPKLQPMETLWATVKAEVAHAHPSDRDLTPVIVPALKRAFANVTPLMVLNSIKAANEYRNSVRAMVEGWSADTDVAAALQRHREDARP